MIGAISDVHHTMTHDVHCGAFLNVITYIALALIMSLGFYHLVGKCSYELFSWTVGLSFVIGLSAKIFAEVNKANNIEKFR